MNLNLTLDKPVLKEEKGSVFRSERSIERHTERYTERTRFNRCGKSDEGNYGAAEPVEEKSNNSPFG